MKKNKIAIIGCGNIGLSIVQGFIKSNKIDPAMITVTRKNIGPIKNLSKKGIKVTGNNIEAVKDSRLIIIAVKPYKIKEVLDEIGVELSSKKHIIISVATGITIDEIHQLMQKRLPLFRAMPNTATYVGESITCICHKYALRKDIAVVEELFNNLGKSIQIEEELMEAATILGACGIAFALRFIRAMVQGGIEIGFDSATAATIANQTVKGAAELLLFNNGHPEKEIDKVTTPKGCTIVGLNEMEHQGFSSSLIKGIITSYMKIER